MRMVIDEKDVSPDRFRVSDHDMGTVIQEMIPIHDLKEISYVQDDQILITTTS